MTFNRLLNAIALAVLIVGCQASGERGTGSRNFQIARDDTADDAERERAVLKLNESERIRLRSVLLERIPGDHNATTLENIVLLGEIGDEQTAVKLLERRELTYSGKLRAAMSIAADQIRTRRASEPPSN